MFPLLTGLSCTEALIEKCASVQFSLPSVSPLPAFFRGKAGQLLIALKMSTPKYPNGKRNQNGNEK